MKKRVYIETSIVSYLTAKPSRDAIRSVHQKITREWWKRSRNEFDLRVSQFVLDEAAKGDVEAAARRLVVLRAIPLLSVTEEAIALGDELVRNGLLPEKAGADALHLAVAAIHGVDFLLTWNCRHLANAKVKARVGRFARAIGLELPVICTPEELVDEEAQDDF